MDEIIVILNQIPAAIEKAFVEVLRSYPNHPGRPGHVGGSAPKGGGGGGVVEAAQKMFSERAAQLGHHHTSFEKDKGGNLRVMSGGKKTKIIITPDGRILSTYKGKPTSEMTSWGWKQL